MNQTLAIATLTALLTAPQVQARPHDHFIDQGRVTGSTPIYETVRVSEPVETCREAPLPPPPRHHDPAVAGTLAGGLVGGVIGNQFGHGSGRGAMTAVGTLVGAVIGNGLARDHHHPRPPVARQRVCEVVDQYRYEERLVGYRVEYRYKGQHFVTRTAEQPGRYVPVRVEVNALNHY
jgi:uncharacterized protein YcfJ